MTNDFNTCDKCTTLFNSIQFILYSPLSQIPNLPQRVLQSTHTTSLSQDLTSDQEKLPQNRKNPFTGKKGKKPSGEQQRRIPIQDGQMHYMSCVQKESLQSYNTFNEYYSVGIVGSSHAPRSRPLWSIRQMEVERRSGRSIVMHYLLQGLGTTV